MYRLRDFQGVRDSVHVYYFSSSADLGSADVLDPPQGEKPHVPCVPSLVVVCGLVFILAFR